MKYLIAWIKKVIQKIREGRLKELYVQWVWIFQYVRKYWFQVAVYTGLNVTGAVLGLLSSVVSRNLVDSVTGHNSSLLGIAAGMYVGVGVFQIFVNAIRNYISLRLNLKVSTEIKFDIFKQIIRSDWEALSKYRPGDIQYRLNGDVMIIITNVLTFIPTLVSMLISFFGALGIMLKNDVTMAVITLCGAPVSLLVSRYSLAKMRDYQEKNLEFSGANVSFNQELFQNMQTIKAFGLVDAFIDRFRSMQRQSVHLQLVRNKYQQFGTIATSFVGQAIGYVCYGFAIFRLWQGQITYGTMTMLVGMAGSLRGSFSSLVNTIPGMIRTGISAGRVMELTELPREKDEESDVLRRIRENAKQCGVTVCMRDVTAQYGDNKPVYTDAQFIARPGEIIGLVGPSGLGKTTTLKLLLGLLHPRRGTVTVSSNGDCETVSAASRKLFSYIPQSNTIFNGTIADNLKMMREDATEAEMKHALYAASADFVADLEHGIDEEIFENGQTLSEGQKQRISIARAILADTPILLLDEATSALDVATENRVLHRIMQNDPLRTVIVTAHRPSVFAMCTRVYKIEGGSLEKINEQQLQEFLSREE